MTKDLTHRFIARVVVEAKTPLLVGSGLSSLTNDITVLKDHNGLPFIPGTSIAGVLRHSLEDNEDQDNRKWSDIFGYTENEEGLGSRLKVSSAYFVLPGEKVAEEIDMDIDPALKRKLETLPVRQHVRIDEKGVAVKGNLFDNEVVYRGSKFIFELELKGGKNDLQSWESLIGCIKGPLFRIGRGTRNGYGRLEVEKIFRKEFDLHDSEQFKGYLEFDHSLNSKLEYEKIGTGGIRSQYSLELSPDDFFIFANGFGDNESDNMPKVEEIMVYGKNEITFKTKVVIPASSLKGAISHRTCFHHNRLAGKYADREEGSSGIENEAVYRLFGSEREREIDGKPARRGIVLIDDIHLDLEDRYKLFNHLAIDRFTGGALSGALFSEKAVYGKEICLSIPISISEELEKEEHQPVMDSFEAALTDLCKGLLPLGGMTTKGFGCFTGNLYRDGNLIFSYSNQTT
jgi:CRISPR/Cas system CSM-associated protein Csm3 (group 7 of RAMP superfamily)